MTKPTDVYFFATCVIDQFWPEAGLDAMQLLKNAGLRVHFPPGQTCCGQVAYTSGFFAEARQVAAAQLDLFPENWPVVVPSGSCAGMMKHHYPKLFANDAVNLPKALALQGRIYELTEFLVNVLDYHLPPPSSKSSNAGKTEKVVLHTSCSARREMASHLSSRALLQQLPQVELCQQDHEAECCGFGGTFALRQPEISTAMVSDKVASLKASGAERVVSADCGCLLNIRGHADYLAPNSLPAEHIASFLLRQGNHV